MFKSSHFLAIFDFARSLRECGGRGSEVEGPWSLLQGFQIRNSHSNPGAHSLAGVEEREKEDQHSQQPGEVQGTFGMGMKHFSSRA